MRLNRERVIDEALRLVDEEGLDRLSLRSLGGRLQVQAPTLYWHVRSKSELLDGLADAVMDEAITAAPPPADDALEWLLEALTALRAAMLRHRDGARIVSGSRFSLRRADFSELAMAALVRRGVDLQRARLLVLAGERYTMGWVLEEQAPAPDGAAPSEEELRARFPVAAEAIREYFIGTGRTADDLYADGARLILGLPAAGTWRPGQRMP